MKFTLDSLDTLVNQKQWKTFSRCEKKVMLIDSRSLLNDCSSLCSHCFWFLCGHSLLNLPSSIFHSFLRIRKFCMCHNYNYSIVCSYCSIEPNKYGEKKKTLIPFGKCGRVAAWNAKQPNNKTRYLIWNRTRECEMKREFVDVNNHSYASLSSSIRTRVNTHIFRARARFIWLPHFRAPSKLRRRIKGIGWIDE